MGFIKKSEVAKLVCQFFFQNDISGLLYKKAMENNSNCRRPSRSLVYNLGEAYCIFKRQFSELDIDMTTFGELLPSRISLPNVREQGFCEYCENINYLFQTKTLYNHLGVRFKSIDEVMRKLVCSSESEQCMTHQCHSCGVWRNFSDIFEVSFDSYQNEFVTYKQLKPCGLEKETLLWEDFASKFISQMITYTAHIFTQRHQSQKLSSQISSIQEGQVIFLMNYSDLTKEFKEILKKESCFVGPKHRQQVEMCIYDVIVYYRLNGAICHRSYAVLSNVAKCTPYEIWTFNSHILDDLRKCGITIDYIYFWSNSDRKYFKNKESMAILSHIFIFGVDATWNFHANHHGREIHDDVTSIIKKDLCDYFKERISTIESTKEIISQLCKRISSAVVLFVSKKDVREHRDLFLDILDKARPVKGLNSAHSVIPVGPYKVSILKSVSSEDSGKVYDFGPLPWRKYHKNTKNSPDPVMGSSVPVGGQENGSLSLEPCFSKQSDQDSTAGSSEIGECSKNDIQTIVCGEITETSDYGRTVLVYASDEPPPPARPGGKKSTGSNRIVAQLVSNFVKQQGTLRVESWNFDLEEDPIGCRDTDMESPSHSTVSGSKKRKHCQIDNDITIKQEEQIKVEYNDLEEQRSELQGNSLSDDDDDGEKEADPLRVHPSDQVLECKEEIDEPQLSNCADDKIDNIKIQNQDVTQCPSSENMRKKIIFRAIGIGGVPLLTGTCDPPSMTDEELTEEVSDELDLNVKTRNSPVMPDDMDRKFKAGVLPSFKSDTNPDEIFKEEKCDEDVVLNIQRTIEWVIRSAVQGLYDRKGAESKSDDLPTSNASNISTHEDKDLVSKQRGVRNLLTAFYTDNLTDCPLRDDVSCEHFPDNTNILTEQKSKCQRKPGKRKFQGSRIPVPKSDTIVTLGKYKNSSHDSVKQLIDDSNIPFKNMLSDSIVQSESKFDKSSVPGMFSTADLRSTSVPNAVECSGVLKESKYGDTLVKDDCKSEYLSEQKSDVSYTLSDLKTDGSSLVRDHKSEVSFVHNGLKSNNSSILTESESSNIPCESGNFNTDNDISGLVSDDKSTEQIAVSNDFCTENVSPIDSCTKKILSELRKFRIVRINAMEDESSYTEHIDTDRFSGAKYYEAMFGKRGQVIDMDCCSYGEVSERERNLSTVEDSDEERIPRNKVKRKRKKYRYKGGKRRKKRGRKRKLGEVTEETEKELRDEDIIGRKSPQGIDQVTLLGATDNQGDESDPHNNKCEGLKVEDEGESNAEHETCIKKLKADGKMARKERKKGGSSIDADKHEKKTIIDTEEDEGMTMSHQLVKKEPDEAAEVDFCFSSHILERLDDDCHTGTSQHYEYDESGEPNEYIEGSDLNVYQMNDAASDDDYSEDIDRNSDNADSLLDDDGSLMRDLNAILNAENQANPYQCPECDQVLSSRGNLKRHVNTKHRGLRPYQCSECAAAFSEKRSMEVHVINVHDKMRPFNCFDCGKSFACKTTLATHIKIVHVGDKPFRCDQCSPVKYFARLSSLNFHVKQWHNPDRKPPSEDTRNRNYACPVCDMVCFGPMGVKKHVLFVHEGFRPFHCHVCQSAFKDNGNLRRHIQAVHEGFKPYRCDDCSAAFCDKWGLQKHRDNVHFGVRKHVCRVCNFPFTEKSNLLRHIATVHNGVKPFQCKDCNTKYTQKASLKHHIKVVHNKTIEEAVNQGHLTPTVAY